MIDSSLLLAFAAAVTVLMLIPGPNVALIIANSVSYGAKYGLPHRCRHRIGDGAPARPHRCRYDGVARPVWGAWFEWLRWVGVAYLVYLGIAQWRARGGRPDPDPSGAEIDVGDLRPSDAGVADQPQDAAVLLVRSFRNSFGRTGPSARKSPCYRLCSLSSRCWSIVAGPCLRAGPGACWGRADGCGTGCPAGS